MNQPPSTAVEANWPKEPYKGFSYYTFEDTLLFVGREDDVDDCTAYLAEPKTRTLLLHGRTGCGKSSFLRAGLIPALESRGFGFVFLRRNEGERPVLIRCTADPMARIAEELFWFTGHPWRFETAIDTRLIDISSARFKKDDIRSFTEACRDPHFLMDVFKEISEKLLHTLVIILDQAEEAITQTDTPSPFFDFLKLFNGTNLNIKLVIALRTERFGEFFGYLHFGASIITDVKQYFLQGLDRARVRQAIEQPTLKTIEGMKSPFDVYGFTYQDGLIDTIVSDLFSAPPSGGILPLMQVVCRGLYNEVRNFAAPREITEDRYRSGDGVSGRVDKQIGQSLRAVIRDNLPSIRDIEMEERKWRAGLYKLVRTQPDGTVGTDLKTEQQLRKILEESGVSGDVSAMLAALADPQVLILRGFKVVSSESESEIVLYSLGHDAVGLVLRQWVLRAEEAEKRRSIEAIYRRRRIMAACAASVAAAALLASFFYIGELTKRRKMVELDVLRLYADGQFRSDPRISATAAINASMIGESILLKGLTTPVQTTLANIAATLPQHTIRTSLPKSRPGLGGGFVLAGAKKFLFWNANVGVEFLGWDGEERLKLDLAALYGAGRTPQPAALLDASEAAADVFSLSFKSTAGPEFISIVQGGHVVGVYDTSYFVNFSKDVQSHFDPKKIESVQPSRVAPKLEFATDANIVYLYRFSGNNVTLAPFFLEQSKGQFRVGRLTSQKAAPETVEVSFKGFPPGIFFLLSFVSDRPLASPFQPSSGADHRRLAGVLAYDLRKENDSPPIWSLQTSDIDEIKQCLDRTEVLTSPVDRSEACVFRVVDRGISNFLLVLVPPKNKQADAPEPANAGSSMLVAIDVATQGTIKIDVTKMIRSSESGPLEGPFGPKRAPIDFRKVALGGTYGSMVVAMPYVADEPTAQVIDVFKIEGDQPEFIGTYASPETSGRIVFAKDARTMASIDSETARLWDISQPARRVSEALMTGKSAAQLVDIICDSGLPAGVRKDLWRDLLGIDSTPNSPCAD
jgi:hypothetical protein